MNKLIAHYSIHSYTLTHPYTSHSQMACPTHFLHATVPLQHSPGIYSISEASEKPFESNLNSIYKMIMFIIIIIK